MDLKLDGQLFLICGATSGFGKAITEALTTEGAHVIAVARDKDKLLRLQHDLTQTIDIFSCDLTLPGATNRIIEMIGDRHLHGLLLNAGGPPAKTALETKIEDWDQAYHNVLRWKVELTQNLLPKMIDNGYGRIIFLESATVKQPMENLVLSNSMRLAVVGYMKTLSQEVSRSGVTLNVMAPGFHATAAMERIVNKKIEQGGITKDEAISGFVKQTSVGFIGNAEEFASMALWLFSPLSRYITGQVISVDGGLIKGVMG